MMFVQSRSIPVNPLTTECPPILKLFPCAATERKYFVLDTRPEISILLPSVIKILSPGVIATTYNLTSTTFPPSSRSLQVRLIVSCVLFATDNCVETRHSNSTK